MLETIFRVVGIVVLVSTFFIWLGFFIAIGVDIYEKVIKQLERRF